MRVEKDFEEFIGLLSKHKVKYLIVGAYAVSLHAQPRNTGDIDIFVKAEKRNAERLMAALREFGFGGVGLKEEDFLKEDSVVQLGVSPVRIDLMSSITAVDFDKAFHSRVEERFGRQKAWFISFQDLLRNKRAVKRKKDMADVEMLLRAHRAKKKITFD